MVRKLFVGNLSFDTSETDLKERFSQIGTCETASIIRDRMSGRSRGFGFVEMGSEDEAKRAITELNGVEINGRTISVSEAREPSARRAPRFSGAPQGFSFRDEPQGPPVWKNRGSRRGLRAKKRSL